MNVTLWDTSSDVRKELSIQDDRTESDNRIEVTLLIGIAENNLPHIARWESTKPPYAEPHVRWCGRSVNVKIGSECLLWLAFTSYPIFSGIFRLQHGSPDKPRGRFFDSTVYTFVPWSVSWDCVCHFWLLPNGIPTSLQISLLEQEPWCWEKEWSAPSCRLWQALHISPLCQDATFAWCSASSTIFFLCLRPRFSSSESSS